MSRHGRGCALGRAVRTLSSNRPDHETRTRIRGGGRWQALCSCGWGSRDTLKWAVSARDAAAGHLLEVQS